jgi:hypothetical protein
MQLEQKPTSQRQIAANRRNSLKSTGPASPRGRAVSSQNARKYDLLPYEDPALPAQLTAQLYGIFVPLNRKERLLVDALVFSERILLNCKMLEKRIRAHEFGNAKKDGRTRAQALEAISDRLFELSLIRKDMKSVQNNALRQLDAVHAKAA